MNRRTFVQALAAMLAAGRVVPPRLTDGFATGGFVRDSTLARLARDCGMSDRHLQRLIDAGILTEGIHEQILPLEPCTITVIDLEADPDDTWHAISIPTRTR